MPKQAVNFNFSNGLDTKSDPFQVAFGKFLVLNNSVYSKTGRLQKRQGYGLVTATSPVSSYVTTLNDNLISIGNTVNAYSPSLNAFVSKGTLSPCSLNVLPLIRNNLNQSQCDSAIANEAVVTVYTEVNNGTPSYLYVIADSITGQNLVKPTAIPVIASGAITGSSRVYVIGNYFVIISPVVVAGTTFLQYASIPVGNIASISAAQNVTSQSHSKVSQNPGWDAVVTNSTLVVAFNTTSGGQGVHVATLTTSQIALNAVSSTILSVTNAANIAAILSICADITNPTVCYISFWNNATSNGYTFGVDIGFNTITLKFATQQIITAIVTVNLASSAQNGKCLVFSEVTKAYSYDAGIPSNFIKGVTVTSAGVVGTPYVVIRSVGLASKSFIVNGTIYFLSAYTSPFQPTYFLINGSTSTSAMPIIVAKLAYENGGGYVTLGLPNITVNSNIAQIPYLFKDLIQALNTINNPQQTTAGGIYSQTGINLVSFTIGTKNIDTSEIGSVLHISGGYLGMFDGYLPVEHNFFLWPDSIEAVGSGSGGVMLAQQYYYQVTYEWSDNAGNIYRSAPSIPVTVTTTGTTSSVTVNIPMLRLTAKTANPVKIVIYRWSTGNQVYNQVTSITAPTLNDTTVDSVAYVDTLGDASIIGNNIIYTTGGVVEDVNAPSTTIMTLFDTRLWLVDAENPNTLWVSKQVIPATPVEMSDLFKIFVSPNTGTVSSTGPITALAPMDDKLIVFSHNAIFMITGIGPNNLGTTSVGCSLGNYSQPMFVTSTVGCTNQQSIVLTKDGLMFESDKGIWLLQRNLQTVYIGAPVEAFNDSLVNSANSIPETNYVLFTLNTGEMLMYDYFEGQWGTFSGAPATSSCIYNGLHTLLSQYGPILQQTPDQYMDNQEPVLLSFTTSWLNLAGLQGYERIYDFYLMATYLSPHMLQCQVAYDYNPSIQHQVLITPKNFSPSVPGPFGIPTPFGSPGSKEQWRIHAKRQLTEAIQLSITEVFDPSNQTVPGAGFTMSGVACNVLIKKGTKPIKGSSAAGLA